MERSSREGGKIKSWLRQVEWDVRICLSWLEGPMGVVVAVDMSVSMFVCWGFMMLLTTPYFGSLL
jgi:hypothetical protein